MRPDEIIGPNGKPLVEPVPLKVYGRPRTQAENDEIVRQDLLAEAIRRGEVKPE
jgi:hypothetical protein